jgi:hypothetical protein
MPNEQCTIYDPLDPAIFARYRAIIEALPKCAFQRHLLAIMRADGQCWQYPVCINKGTHYAEIRIGSERHLAHRLVYQLLVAPPPADLVTDHLCRHRACRECDRITKRQPAPYIPADATVSADRIYLQ